MALFGNGVKTGTQRLEEQHKEACKAHATVNSLFRSAPAPVQKATGGLSASGNVPTVLLAGSAVETRKAAEAAAGRVVVQKRATVMRLVHLDASLSANAVAALEHVVQAWQRAGRKGVEVLAADLAKATKMTVERARAALDELRGTGHLVDVVDHFGKRRIMPTSKVTQAVAE